MSAAPDTVTFAHGQIVQRRTNDEVNGIIRGIVTRDGGITYLVRFDDEADEREFYEFELTAGGAL